MRQRVRCLYFCLQVRWAGLQAAGWAQVCPACAQMGAGLKGSSCQDARKEQSAQRLGGFVLELPQMPPDHSAPAEPSHVTPAESMGEGVHSLHSFRWVFLQKRMTVRMEVQS